MDAMRISTMTCTYVSILLPYFYDSDTRITYISNSLMLESSQPLTQEAALNIFQNFAVKKGTKVAYITQCPSVLQKKRKQKAKATVRQLKI